MTSVAPETSNSNQFEAGSNRTWTLEASSSPTRRQVGNSTQETHYTSVYDDTNEDARREDLLLCSSYQASKDAWKRQMRRALPLLYVFSVICAIMGIKFGTCATGAPDALFYVMAVMMILSMFAQVSSFRPFLISKPRPDFLNSGCFAALDWAFTSLIIQVGLGLMDTSDFLSNGQQVAQAYLCNDKYQETFSASMRQSALPGFLSHCSLWGLMTWSLVLASVASMVLAYCCLGGRVDTGESDTQAHFLSSLLGIGEYSVVFAHTLDGEDSGASSMFTSLLKIPTTFLFETLPHFYLQTMLFSLTFAHTSDNSKYKQLVSLALGAGAIVKEVASLLPVVVELGRCFGNSYNDWCGFVILGSIFALPLCFAVGLVVVCFVRLYFSYICSDHVWNLTSGCVSL
eukprot:TRINITY_DN72914_c0_g1_i1.p1 TRINITY_DN72914_c0_g1~~TRINITY_DN72914_c0_g1_i1.p1  ORF type:complete len:401 (-),score=21.81 TRINITY_DN72914_c0_g1_i1:267-1469(-)